MLEHDISVRVSSILDTCLASTSLDIATYYDIGNNCAELCWSIGMLNILATECKCSNIISIISIIICIGTCFEQDNSTLESVPFVSVICCFHLV